MSCLKDFTSRVQTLKNQLLKQAEDRESCSAGQQRGSGGIPLARKMCYAVGGVPYQMTTVALGVSLQIFLLDVVQMEASYVSMILFVSRAWDAVTDPLIGYLVGRSNWTPIGKLTPWLVLSSPFGVLSYLLLWFVPGGSMSPAVRVLWFLTAACLFETIMSQKAFLTSALVMGALFFLCSLVLFLGVTEQRAALCSDDRVRPPYLTSLKMLMCHIPYQRLLLGFVFSALAFQMSLGNFALFCSHAAGLGAHFQHLLLALLLSASVAVPLWQTVLLRIGKKVTVFIGLSLFIPASIIVACVPSNLPVFMIMCILMGFSIATVFLLPWSMLPDVVDDFAARHPSYKDLEPLFFSCYAFCSKLAGGLSVGISTMTLHFVGYRASACIHGDGVVTALVVLFSPVPIALLLMGMVFFRSYPINERQSLQLQEQPTTVCTEATSSSSETREHNSERPTNVQPPRDDVTTTSHSNTKTNATSHQSKSSPRCYKHDKKCSVKSSVPSDVSQSCSGEYSGPKSVVKSDVNLKRHEQRLSRYPQPGEDKSGRNVPENDPGTSSSRSNVKSKVSWV
ncbi:sodium-dependent lysophosphatidylcholine symporter 1 isoform X3 [Acanthopagrus latus]|uniref:sodium-dependent lysophosphatidylcholine symporter 1 isoform X3 n=1 Tax=Acanthopagrus latus TaxID=8177 RepID=UPI00187C8299|nr:sodium-dependent lysophosphatidylcholine symporter 1 isoform X3 [Acanthopagrus latus]